jgi:PTH1 family peptidyl-tRNA hydrolase
VRSIIDTFGSDEFGRMRLGVRGPAREAEDLADYVLRPFPQDEEPVARRLACRAADAVSFIADQGLESGMNRYNGQDVSSPPGSAEAG